MDDLLLKPPLLERPHLESLTTHELIHLADSFGIDIPPGLERLFIIAELMEIASDDPIDEAEPEKYEGVSFAEAPMPEMPEPVFLPKQYNITFIEVMIRDPLWAFTFWEIKSHDKEFYEKAADFGGYYLKVSPVPLSKTIPQEDPFTIPVGITDTAWYIGFPPEGGRFKVEICVLRKAEEIVLTASRPFTLPPVFNPPERGRIEGCGKDDRFYENPLIQLSGLEDFHVLRNVDRRPRIKWEGIPRG